MVLKPPLFYRYRQNFDSIDTFGRESQNTSQEKSNGEITMEKKEEKTTKPMTFLGECKRAAVLAKVAESQKKEQEEKNKEEAEKATGRFINAFCVWFEKRFSLKRKTMLNYTKEDRVELCRMFEEEQKPKAKPSFISVPNSLPNGVVSALNTIREYYGEEYFPHDALEYHIKWYS